MTTTLYTAMVAAEELFSAEDTLLHLNCLEEAERAYFAALKIARSRWNAIPEGEEKDNAEINANDTRDEGVFEARDELAWFDIAIATFEMNVG